MSSTSSNNGTFYFAYGSNLSPEQMAHRCNANPHSSQPVAIARLDGWKWFISERGYANVAPTELRSLSQPRAPSPSPPTADPSQSGQAAPSQRPPHSKLETYRADVVWGMVYNLSIADEDILDDHEGHNVQRNRSPRPNHSSAPEQVRRKPFLQDGWHYNKMYLEVKITKWLQDPRRYALREDAAKITAMVYVDENSTQEGSAQREYVPRMNRAIKQSTALGLPKPWVQNVMRRRIAEEPISESSGGSKANKTSTSGRGRASHARGGREQRE